MRQHFSAEVAPLVRVQARTVWELLIFLLNGVIFILIGLQLGPLRRTLAPSSAGQVLRWGVIITLTAIVVRLLWMPVGARLVRIDRKYREKNPVPPPVPSSSWAGPGCAASCRSPRRSRFR